MFSIFLLLFIIGKRNEKGKKIFRIILALCALFLQISYTIWLIGNDIFTLKSGLPLYLCSISLILVFFVNITRNKYLFILLYFWGLPSSIYAILFPDLLYNFFHFRCMQFFMAHGIIILAIFYFIFIEKYFISFKESVIAYFVTLFYIGIVFVVNIILNSNYLYLMRKPAVGSVVFEIFKIDYRIILFFLVNILFFISYLPFLIIKIFHSKKILARNF